MVKLQDTVGEASGDGASTWTGRILSPWVALPPDRAHPELSRCPLASASQAAWRLFSTHATCHYSLGSTHMGFDG